jgi:Flp pilus assembly pilin Flp
MPINIDQLKKKGQGMVEYVFILALVSIMTLVMASMLGNQVNSTFSKIGSGLAP